MKIMRYRELVRNLPDEVTRQRISSLEHDRFTLKRIRR
jgi:hypothetical protein